MTAHSPHTVCEAWQHQNWQYGFQIIWRSLGAWREDIIHNQINPSRLTPSIQSFQSPAVTGTPLKSKKSYNYDANPSTASSRQHNIL